MNFQSQQTIGPYTLVRPIGQGAFGVVWLAERHGLVTTQLAVKIALSLTVDREVIRQEAQVWQKASGHPNVLPVIEAAEYDRQIIIVSEYVEGGSLNDWLVRHGGRAPTLEAALAMAGGVLAGLRHLHDREIIHRDLKPGNVLLQAEMPRLTDFGMARAHAAGESQSVSGTPAYMAPEAFQGGYSVQSDLWSVGIMLYEMLTGQPPFRGAGIIEIMLAIQANDAPPLPESCTVLEPILQRALQKEPDRRFASAQEMQEALRNATSPSLNRSLASPVPNEIPQDRAAPPATALVRLHNLPAPMTSFIGRERESAELTDLLLHHNYRMVTVTGPGGTGKTRLSLHVAGTAAPEYPEGVWLADLSGLTDAREVPSTLALALTLSLSSEKSVASQVFASLRHRRCLLLLDNFEQVIEAARFVNELLRECPAVTCLVTSQHLLQINGEVEYPLSPLDVPPRNVTLATCTDYASVRLFLDRAGVSNPHFGLSDETLPAVTEICRRLEGIPLAIELAAALVRGLTPQQILPRLKNRFKLLASTRRDLDSRERSLRGALDWSYDLLGESERALFAELSVFAGGFFLDDVEAVCSTEDAFLLTIGLRDKSLLKTEETPDGIRYSMLETLREYAAEKLAAAGKDAETRACHAKRYLESAQEWAEQLSSSRSVVQRMIAEIDNLRAGMDWAAQAAESALVVDYGRALARFFLARGLYDEGDRRLVMAEDAARSRKDLPSLAHLLLQRGRIAEQCARLDEAKAHYTESHRISQNLPDEPRRVAPLTNLGNIAWFQGDFEMARRLWHESLELAVATGQPVPQATLLSSLSVLACDHGRFEEATDYLERSLELHRRSNNQKGLAFTLAHYGETLRCQKQFDDALFKLEESRRLFEEIGYKYGSGLIAVGAGRTLLEAGRTSEAESRVREGLAIATEIGDRRCEMYALAVLGRIAGESGDMLLAREQFSRSASIGQELRDIRHLTDVVRFYGEALLRNGFVAEARTLLFAAHRYYAERGLHDAAATRERLDAIENQRRLLTEPWKAASTEFSLEETIRSHLS